MHKRRSFDYEREIRAVVQVLDVDEETGCCPWRTMCQLDYPYRVILRSS